MYNNNIKRLLDFTGGSFSTLQVILEGPSENINIVKFVLGIIAMGFDVIFIL